MVHIETMNFDQVFMVMMMSLGFLAISVVLAFLYAYCHSWIEEGGFKLPILCHGIIVPLLGGSVFYFVLSYLQANYLNNGFSPESFELRLIIACVAALIAIVVWQVSMRWKDFIRLIGL